MSCDCALLVREACLVEHLQPSMWLFCNAFLLIPTTPSGHPIFVYPKYKEPLNVGTISQPLSVCKGQGLGDYHRMILGSWSLVTVKHSTEPKPIYFPQSQIFLVSFEILVSKI